jgi:hypothetical protein
VIECFQVIFERLAADGDALLNYGVVSTGLSVFPSIAFDV